MTYSIHWHDFGRHFRLSASRQNWIKMAQSRRGLGLLKNKIWWFTSIMINVIDHLYTWGKAPFTVIYCGEWCLKLLKVNNKVSNIYRCRELCIKANSRLVLCIVFINTIMYWRNIVLHDMWNSRPPRQVQIKFRNYNCRNEMTVIFLTDLSFTKRLPMYQIILNQFGVFWGWEEV